MICVKGKERLKSIVWIPNENCMSLHYKALITMDLGHVYRTVGGPTQEYQHLEVDKFDAISASVRTFNRFGGMTTSRNDSLDEFDKCTSNYTKY